MSDPVSNLEIEDVLSSIRRLVSVNNRGGVEEAKDQEPKTQVSHDDDQDIDNDAELNAEIDPEDVPDTSIYAETEEEPASQGLELGTTGAKLVLTPSLRVNEEPDVAEADGADQDEEVLEFTHHSEADDLSGGSDSSDSYEEEFELDDLEDHEPLADHDDPLKAPEEGSDFVRLRPEARARDWVSDENDVALETAESEETETDWSNEDLEEPDNARELSAPAEQDDVEIWTEDALDDAEEVESDADYSRSVSGETELEARIAEVEAAVAARSEQWDPDAAEQDDYAGGKVEPLPWEDRGADDAGESETAPVEEYSPEEVEAIEDAILLTEDMVAEPDEIVEDPVDMAQFEDDIEAIGTDEPMADNLEAELSETVADAVIDQTAQSTAEAAWYSEDVVLDEDALRDLVSEIVRQELQGALGERITRNVRKLVRREIHRAMMGQDYD